MTFGLFSPGNPVPGAEPYDLTNGGARNGPDHFASGYQWPIAPELSLSDAVSTIAALQSAVAIDGNEITLTAGFGTQAGDLNITGDDVKIIAPNSATVDGNIVWAGRRIHWVGGNHTGGYLAASNAYDVLIDNLNSYNEAGTENNFSTMRERFAIINSTLRGNATSNGWLIYADALADNADFIFANVKLQHDNSGAQTFRVNRVTRLIIADSYLNVGNVAGNSLRMHAGTRDIWIPDSVVGRGWLNSGNPGGGNSQYPYGTINALIERMIKYADGGHAYLNSDHSQDSFINDGTLYSADGPGTGTPSTGSYGGTGNTEEAWNGQAASMVDASPYGADH